VSQDFNAMTNQPGTGGEGTGAPGQFNVESVRQGIAIPFWALRRLRPGEVGSRRRP